jgi:hypothetical protein
MFKTINETIKVTSSFFRDRVTPEKFEWNGQQHIIEKSKLVHAAKKGEGKMFFFDVNDNRDFYKLSFDTKSLEWELNQVFIAK